MHNSVLLGMTAALTACALPAQTQTSTARETGAIISASGEGRREMAPDKATIVLGVETRARTPAAAASANADRMTAIRGALVRAGVAERDVAIEPGGAGPVDDTAIADDDVVRRIGAALVDDAAAGESQS